MLLPTCLLLPGNRADGGGREGAPAAQSPALLLPLPRVQGHEVLRPHTRLRRQAPQDRARVRTGKSSQVIKMVNRSTEQTDLRRKLIYCTASLSLVGDGVI